jgi:hypothetical protein
MRKRLLKRPEACPTRAIVRGRVERKKIAKRTRITTLMSKRKGKPGRLAGVAAGAAVALAVAEVEADTAEGVPSTLATGPTEGLAVCVPDAAVITELNEVVIARATVVGVIDGAEDATAAAAVVVS